MPRAKWAPPSAALEQSGRTAPAARPAGRSQPLPLLRSARARQRAGVTTLRPELDARLALLREQDAASQIDYAALVADIQLQAALGGG